MSDQLKQALPLDTAVSFDPYAGEPGRDGDQCFSVNPDGTVFFRLKAPNAKTVQIDQFGSVTPLAPAEDGMWEGNVDLGRGFKYFFLKIDGADSTPTSPSATDAAARCTSWTCRSPGRRTGTIWRAFPTEA